MKPITHFKFRPRFWPTVFTIPAVLFMIALSVWQVQRLYWKEGLINERTERTTADPIALPSAGSDIETVDFHRVRLQGQFDNDHEFYMPARSQNGNVGYWIITPLIVDDGKSVVLINRGWVPDDRKDPGRRAEGQLEGMVTVDGIIRQPQKQAWFQPPNEPLKNRWFYLSPAEMALASGLPLRADLYLDAVKSDVPGGFPIGGQTRINLPNDHLSYALTWGALAVALIVIYVLFHLDSGKAAPPPGTAREPGDVAPKGDSPS
jgi:surfeit locus 1 family protein